MIKQLSSVPGQREQSVPTRSVGGQTPTEQRLESMLWTTAKTRSLPFSPSSSGPRRRLLSSEKLQMTESSTLPRSPERKRNARLSTRDPSLADSKKSKRGSEEKKRKKKEKKMRAPPQFFFFFFSFFPFRELRRSELIFRLFFTPTTATTTMQLRCGAARGGLASSRSSNVSNGGRVRGAMLSAPRSHAATTLNAYVGLAACNALHAGVVSRSASAPFGAVVRSNVRRGRGAVGCRAMFERFTEVRRGFSPAPPTTAAAALFFRASARVPRSVSGARCLARSRSRPRGARRAALERR